MQICVSEIIKTVKKIEEETHELKKLRSENATYSYVMNEVPIKPQYEFMDINHKIYENQRKIRYLRNLIAQINSSTIVEHFGQTLGECIVHLGQTKQEISDLQRYINKQQKSRSTTYSGDVEYTELNYISKDVESLFNQLKLRLSKLQIDIDRTNLNTYREVPEDICD